MAVLTADGGVVRRVSVWFRSSGKAAFVALAGAAALFGLPARARANGAFPAPFKLFAPADRPDEMVATTNYGIIETLDGGKSWSWMCEHHTSEDAYLYQQAAAPSRRMFAISFQFIFTEDNGCSWTHVTGLPEDGEVTDYFPDPSDSNRVFAIVRRNAGSGLEFSLFASTDGGTTFPATPLYAPPGGLSLDSVEVAKSDANRVYIALSSTTVEGGGPWIGRSDDGGHSFTMTDVSATTGNGTLKIATVDPAAPERVFFRFETLTPENKISEALFVSTDGGHTVKKSYSANPDFKLTAFYVAKDGTTMFVADVDNNGGPEAHVSRSKDGGATFTLLPQSLHVGSFVERAGSLYVLANGASDPFLVGVSKDKADTPFAPYVKASDVSGVRSCSGVDFRDMCTISCDLLLNQKVFTETQCKSIAGASTGGQGGASSGCSCAISPDVESESSVGYEPFAGFTLIATALATRRLKRRPRFS